MRGVSPSRYAPRRARHTEGAGYAPGASTTACRSCAPMVAISSRIFAHDEHARGRLLRQTKRGLMNRRLSPVQDPEMIGRRRPVDIEPPEALDPGAAFALRQWGTAKRLAQLGRPPRRRRDVQAGIDLPLSINGAKQQMIRPGELK